MAPRPLAVLCWILVSAPALATAAAATRAAAPSAQRVRPAPTPPLPQSIDSAGIDNQIAAAWRRHNLSPSHPADDATFLRRATLDLTGIIPTLDAVRAFLADRSRDKRARLVDSLLESPRYAQHFTDYWEAILFGRSTRRQEIDRDSFREWFAGRLGQNQGWDKLVFDLVTAKGVNSRGRPDQPPLPDEVASTINPPVNFLLLYDRNPQDLGGSVSRELLGVQIQCAQCHNHPTEGWTQDDFRRFVASFARLRNKPLDDGKVMGIRRIEVSDAPKPQGGGKGDPEREAISKARPAALDGTELNQNDPRRALGTWMVSPKNPWFARELVNRYFAYFIGRGFSEPIDDLRPSNPVVMPRLLDALAGDFASHGFDIKRLLRQLCKTQVYQLSSGPSRGKDLENKLWARHPLRPMAPLELLDSVVAATDLQAALAKVAPTSDRLGQIRAQLEKTVSFVFDLDEELAPMGFEGTVQQMLLLMNGSLINTGAGAIPDAALAALLKQPGGDREKIEVLYLRTLSRRPTPEELDHFDAFLISPRELSKGQGKPPTGGGGGLLPDPLRGLYGKLKPQNQTPRQQAYEDLFWALLNSSEFIFRH